MPIPSPRKGEKEKDFVSRCMANDVMKSEYPDQKQNHQVEKSQTKVHWRIQFRKVKRKDSGQRRIGTNQKPSSIQNAGSGIPITSRTSSPPAAGSETR